MIKNRRGYVLAQVLLVGVVSAILAVSLAQMLMSRAATSGKVTAQAQGQRQAEGSFSRALAAWNAAGVCAAIPGYTCTGGCVAGTCDCILTPAATECLPSGGCANGGLPGAETAGLLSDPGRCPAAVTAAMVSGKCEIKMTTCR